MRVGAIDIGSNSVRLLVADVVPDGPLTTVARAGEPCRLARDLGRTGEILPELAERAARIASEFADRARSLGATRLLAGGTAALRSARNGSEVARLISDRSGVPVRILSGDEEAKAVYEAVVSGLGAPGAGSACLVFDIGGGSTEVVSGVGTFPGRWTSLPFGAVSLTERFLSTNPPAPAEIENLDRHVAELLMHECALMPTEAPLLAGVGGTITVLAMLDRQMVTYDPVVLDGWRIPGDRLAGLMNQIERSTDRERRLWPAMGEGRADIVVAGCRVVHALVRRFPSTALTCSTQGLRYGLARMAAAGPRGLSHPAPGDSAVDGRSSPGGY